MDKQAPSVIALNSIPADVVAMLGPPPLLPTEDEKLYFAILARIARPIRSPDIVTWMLIKDLADHRFEIARYRRMKTRLIQGAADQERARSRAGAEHTEKPYPSLHTIAALEVAIRGVNGNDPRFNELVDQEVRDMQAREEALELQRRGSIEAPELQPLSDDDFVGVFGNWIDDHERIDVLLRGAEHRFAQALREIERHTSGFGRLLRDDWDKVVDGEVISATE
jgi:hypothetical protein